MRHVRVGLVTVISVLAIAFAYLTSGDLPVLVEGSGPEPGEVFRDCADCPEMVVLRGGQVALGRYGVAVGEYRAFASATGRGAGDCFGESWRDPGFPQTDRHPVTCVSWDDAQEYVSWLSRTTGATYQLPTEEEWGRAAAGSQPGCGWEPARGRGTCPVGSYSANGAGLSDMVGNVWEWTADCWKGTAATVCFAAAAGSTTRRSSLPARAS